VTAPVTIARPAAVTRLGEKGVRGGRRSVEGLGSGRGGQAGGDRCGLVIVNGVGPVLLRVVIVGPVVEIGRVGQLGVAGCVAAGRVAARRVVGPTRTSRSGIVAGAWAFAAAARVGGVPAAGRGTGMVVVTAGATAGAARAGPVVAVRVVGLVVAGRGR
jgi:hypothetical protein